MLATSIWRRKEADCDEEVQRISERAIVPYFVALNQNYPKGTQENMTNSTAASNELDTSEIPNQ
jgi:hypothetical protein